MLQIAICEDQPEQARREARLVAESAPELCPRTQLFQSAEEMLEAVEKGYHPRIAVLDIELGGKDGISLAESLNTLLPDCSIIYLTAYLQYAPEVYSTRHTYFIMKQDAPERLGKAIVKAMEEQSRDDVLCFRTADGLRFARCRDVVYLERVLHKTRIQLSHEACSTTASPSELLRGREDRFLRCHQSYWVNPDYIRSMRSDSFELTDGAVLPITRSYRKSVREKLLTRLSAELHE